MSTDSKWIKDRVHRLVLLLMCRQELKFNKITHVCHKKRASCLSVINNEG